MSLVLQSGIGFGSGNGKHNLGWYATVEALQEAHPEGKDGDYAVVGSTDTVWVWDSDTNAWVDTDTKGQVTTVNGQTGDVTVQETLVNQENIKSVNGNSLLGSGNLEIAAHLEYPSTWPTTSATTTKAFCDVVAADTSAIEGKMYLGEVRWSDLPGLVNGEVEVEIMSGSTAQNKVIVLTLTSGNKSPYLWKYTYWNGGSNVSGWKGFVPTTEVANRIYGTDASGNQTTYTKDSFGKVDDVRVGNSSVVSGKIARLGTMAGESKDDYIGQLTDMSYPTAGMVGKIVQYAGTTDANYTNGYFYKCVAVQGEASYSIGDIVGDITVTIPNGLDATIFQWACRDEYSYIDTAIHCFYRQWDFPGEEEPMQPEWEWENGRGTGGGMGGSGIEVTGNPVANESEFYIYYTAAGLTYIWQRVDVQPAPDMSSKVDKTTSASKVYGTDAQGEQTTYDVNSFGQVDDVKINNTSIVSNKIANITIDSVLDANSTNAIQNGTVKTALDDKSGVIFRTWSNS